MLTITMGVVAFTAIVVLLVTTLMVSRWWLTPSGNVAVEINDDPSHTIEATPGTTLLGALSDADIHIPSACGGKGSCGHCKVVVKAGNRGLLPTELGHVQRGEARRGFRLACQLRLAEDVTIELPSEALETRTWRCKVRSNRNVATFIKEVVLELPPGEQVPFRAGGYIQVECPPHELAYRDIDVPPDFRPDWEAAGLFDLVSRVDEPVTRAYSMANYPGEKGIIKLNVRIATPPPKIPDAPPGKMSSWLFSLRPGAEVSISGPFGEFFAQETDREMVFIGGGAGMAPLRAHIFDQLLRLHSTRKISFWYGARSLREAFYQDEFDALQAEYDNFEWHLALSDPRPEDDWDGPKGFIHQVLRDHYLEQHPQPEDVEYYLCGPPPMMKAALQMLDELGVEPENIRYDEF